MYHLHCTEYAYNFADQSKKTVDKLNLCMRPVVNYRYKHSSGTVFCQVIVGHFSGYRLISINAHKLLTSG